MSYNADCFGRLSALLDGFAATQEESNGLAAELYAYSAELARIRAELEYCLSQAFPSEFSAATLNEYCRYFGISLSLSQERKRTLVTDALARGTTPFAVQEFYRKAGEIDSNFEPNISGFVLDLLCYGGDIFPHLAEISRLVDEYIPPCLEVRGASSGRTFAVWDALDKTFGELDSLGLRYMTIETL